MRVRQYWQKDTCLLKWRHVLHKNLLNLSEELIDKPASVVFHYFNVAVFGLLSQKQAENSIYSANSFSLYLLKAVIYKKQKALWTCFFTL